MCEVIDSNEGFPALDHDATKHILDEKLSEDMRVYLSRHPDKQRRAGNWLWQSPNKIRRGLKEPGYFMACRDWGMGHFDALVWHPDGDKWSVVRFGGNSVESSERYENWLSSSVSGTRHGVAKYMDMCVNDTLSEW